MSTHAEIVRVHETETKYKLRPHLARPIQEPAVIQRDPDGRLRVSLRDLLSPATYERLQQMGLIQ